MPATAELVTVDFHGDVLEAVRGDDGRVWVSIRKVCEGLGLSPDAQRVKLEGKSWATTAMIAVVAQDGKRREVAAVDLDALPMWLATIEPARVAEHVRPKLERYQVECARVLKDHFFPSSSGDPIIDTLAEEWAAAAAPPFVPLYLGRPTVRRAATLAWRLSFRSGGDWFPFPRDRLAGLIGKSERWTTDLLKLLKRDGVIVFRTDENGNEIWSYQGKQSREAKYTGPQPHSQESQP